MEKAYVYALAANFSFAVGVQFFTHYARNLSSSWVNSFKALAAMILFLATILLSGGFHSVNPQFAALFMVSGFVGLGAADLFIIKSFSLMGPGRTMMLFGFQPLIIGVFSYFLLGQSIDSRKFWAVFFFIACLFVFSLESYKKNGHWNIRAGAFALLGVALDGIGVVITRYSFNASPQLGTTEGNFYRAAGGIIFFVLLSRIRPFGFFRGLNKLGKAGVFWIAAGSFAGTYLSLVFYLAAVRQAGALAAVSGIAITGTIFAAIFECIMERRLPSVYLAAAFVLFFAGMRFLLF